MSIARMSAGAGYRYLLRNIASADMARVAGEPLVRYYAASGNPPGRWLGGGLHGLATDAAGINGAGGLTRGQVVTEEAMTALYGRGHHPVTGASLGRPYPVYKPAARRIADAVAGYDLTFTVPKSASLLWALGDEQVQAAVVAAHREAVDTVLALIEDRFLFTRTGTNSSVQVGTRGLIAAAFDHYDSRAGDPNLHTHVVIANKVQGPDGAWRSVDAQVLFAAAVACSEVFDTVFADALATRLPLSWSYRDRGPRRTAAYEIDGISEDLLAGFSQRSQQITTAVAEMLAHHDRPDSDGPSRTTTIKLRQQATLATRPDKHLRSLTELRATWRERATRIAGENPGEIVEEVVRPRRFGQRGSGGAVNAAEVELLAEEILTGLTVRRSTWTRANTLAEAARATKHLRTRTPSDRVAILDRVTDAALAVCVALDPPANATSRERFAHPGADLTPDATVTEVRGEPSTAAHDTAFTTAHVLRTEAALLAALEDLGSPVVSAGVATVAVRPVPGQRLSPDQQGAITAIATSGRRLDVLVGPAGTGKTRALAYLSTLWQYVHGPGSVVGLAPSATAASELAGALRVPCETTTKWLHEQDRQVRPVAGMLAATSGTGTELRAGTLVIVDEASLASTADLHAILRHAQDAGGKLLLVGDHHQLPAVGAGGAFALLVESATTGIDGREHVHELGELWRFTHRWEAGATRALRAGDTAALDIYAQHGRLHEGEHATVLDAAYQAWATDTAAGRASLLLAPDRATVTALNARAQGDRRDSGNVDAAPIRISDGESAGRGDVIVTRRNDRRLALPGGGHVRNGNLWHIVATHPDGSLDAAALSRADAVVGESAPEGRAEGVVRLPASYVRAHVELGYATTVHRAQGVTVDTTHAVITGAMTRQSLYVALTRGREANHAYIPTDEPREIENHLHDPATTTGRQILERILATDGAEHAATSVLRARRLLGRATAGQVSPAAVPARSGWSVPNPLPTRHEGPSR